MRPPFPFSAIVGQPALQRALVLGVIQPGLGGVLIRGTKGVAKSTAVRALAHLLPPIETVAGCPFQRRPGEVIPGWPLPPDAPTCTRPVPLVELPLGATEDRVLGTLHLEKALRGERACEPGLLAAANRGILYIDEVNLLPDHLVDILLDAASAGVHRLEREGVSLIHPARFLLVGTMNPEEGELRPQLLDRFGLAVDVADLADVSQRALAVERRLAYEANPETFVAQWQAADAAEAERIVQAQRLLPRVQASEAIVLQACRLCQQAGVEGLRADLVLCLGASAWAAYQGRTEVTADDLEAVAELALAHRRTRPPDPPQRGARSAEHPAPQNLSRTPGNRPSAPLTEPIGGLFQVNIPPPEALLHDARQPGRWRGAEPERGRRRGLSMTANPALAWPATIRAAAGRQVERGRISGPLRLQAEDLRFRGPNGPVGTLLLLVIDTSGSMAAWRRMRQTKAAVLALLRQAYQRRDLIAMLAFHGEGTELVLPPTRGLTRPRLALEQLPAGGATPLANGLIEASRFLRRQQRLDPRRPTWTVILTDGRGNVNPEATQEAARRLGRLGPTLVIDTETGWPRFGQARVLARTLGGDCLPLETLLTRPIRTREEVA